MLRTSFTIVLLASACAAPRAVAPAPRSDLAAPAPASTTHPVAAAQAPAARPAPDANTDGEPFGDRPVASTPEALLDFLKRLGMGSPKIERRDVISFMMNASHILLVIYDDGDLQLRYAVRLKGCVTGDTNDWNREHRLSRAYLDTDNDPVLESDLGAEGGLSEERVRAFITTFRISMVAFDQLVLTACQSGPH